MNKEIRWKQRLQNYEKAFLLLEKTTKIQKLSEVERGGLIQFFEIAFELAWKTLKDYLEAEGFHVNSPKETLKQAFQMELIKDGHTWIEALEDKNLTTHTYDEATSLKVEKSIKERYFPLLKNLYDVLNSRL